MSKKNTSKGKDTADTSKQSENGTSIRKAKPIVIRHATEEDYKKMDFWNVGTFHRASTFPKTDPSPGEDKSKEKPPQNPEELVEALRKRGFKVNVISNAQLEARRQADLEMETWLGRSRKNR